VQPSSFESEFDQELQSIEQSLLDLKARYAQVQRDQRQRQQLQERLGQIQQDSLQNQLKTELRQIQNQIEDLDVALESRLLSWKNLINPFWQTVRFGGLGLVVGWILRGWVG